MQILDPQIPKPAEREDSVQKRQRPAEVTTVLAIAGAYSKNEIATSTDDQSALHTAKVNELLNMDKFGVVQVVDRPAIATSSVDALGIKTETGRIIQSGTCGTRI